jgi:hypothetical protein
MEERKATRMDDDERQAFLAQLLDIITHHPGIEVVSIERVPEASQPNAREISNGEEVPVS